MRRIGPQQGVSGYHLARWRGLTGRPRAFFLPAPDRNVPRSSQTGPYRHSWPPVTLSCRPGRLSSATTGRCRGHSGGPAIVGSRAVSGSNPMGPSTRTSEQGGSGWCIARSRSSSRARATAWTAPGAATSGNCRSPRRTRNEAESARGRGVSRHHLARWRGLTGRPRTFSRPAPDRNVPRSSQTGPFRHSWPSVALVSPMVGCPPPPPADVAAHTPGVPVVVGSRAVSGSHQIPRSARTRRSGLIQRSPRITT